MVDRGWNDQYSTPVRIPLKIAQKYVYQQCCWNVATMPKSITMHRNSGRVGSFVHVHTSEYTVVS